jgi:hypothetical protein
LERLRVELLLPLALGFFDASHVDALGHGARDARARVGLMRTRVKSARARETCDAKDMERAAACGARVAISRWVTWVELEIWIARRAKAALQV